jgi:plasmid stabilization system protein ParE
VRGDERAARWYDRIVDAIQNLAVAAEWRAQVPEQAEFRELLHQIVFKRRYRILYTIVEDRVHVLCVRGRGMRELGPADSALPTVESGDE